MLYIVLIITIAILALLIVTLLIIKKKSPKTYNSFINWIENSLPEYILYILTFLSLGFIAYVGFRMITPFLWGD